MNIKTFNPWLNRSNAYLRVKLPLLHSFQNKSKSLICECMNAQHHPEQSCFYIQLLGIEWKKCLLDLKHSVAGLYTLQFKMLG